MARAIDEHASPKPGGEVSGSRSTIGRPIPYPSFTSRGIAAVTSAPLPPEREAGYRWGMSRLLRISLLVGFLGVAFSAALGIGLGLVAGYAGGAIDFVIMRIADVQLLLSGDPDRAARRRSPPRGRAGRRFDPTTCRPSSSSSIALSGWVQYARTVRGLTLSREGKEYVRCARVTGRPAPTLITVRHILPNVDSDRCS